MNKGLSPSRQMWNRVMTALVWASAVLVMVLVAGIIGMVLVRGIPHISWKFLSTTASVLKKTDGILPAILNTLYVIVLTLLIVLPLGVGAAVYLTEYASNRRLIEVIEFTNETLAGIPSIIYGLVGMLVFSQALGFQTCLLSGSLTLVVMNLPTIIRTTQESLKTVPQGYREGAMGLGAGKWHIIRTIVLPCSIDGIVTGCILAVGRIVGESAALLFTAGAAEVIAKSVAKAYTSNGATLSVLLYLRAFEDGDFASAWGIGGALLVLVVIFSSNFYIRSILEPVAEITATAKRIAGGSYGVQIRSKYDDEIGDLAATINEMSNQINQNEKMQAEFISSLSHELRTPLTAISGWSETLLSGESLDPEETRRGIAIIQRESRRLTEMVTELLDFTRMEDGRMTLNVEMTDIRAEFEDTVYMYGSRLRQEGIALRVMEDLSLIHI